MNVDFVAITALMVGLGIVVLSLISAGVESLSNATDTRMRGVQIRTSFDPPSGNNGTDHQFGLTDSSSTQSGFSGSVSGQTTGNPGNDQSVGDAGENPNGQDDWGTGSNGLSN